MPLQSFETPSHDQGAARLALLRAELKLRGLDGFLIPHADRFQSEYIPAADERLLWLTGFSGSAGFAVALTERAAVFVDGRYTVQAAEQLDPAAWEIRRIEEVKPWDWTAEAAPSGARIGYDPWLLTPAELADWTRALGEAGRELVALESNPLDAVWPDRPAAPAKPLRVQTTALAGASGAQKRAAAAGELKRRKLDAMLLSASDSVNWLFNIRGSDVTHNPVALGFALLESDGRARLFVDPSRADARTRRHLGNAVALAPESALPEALAELKGKRVGAARQTAPAALAERLKAAGAEVVWTEDPCVKPKARKTPAEIAGARAAQLRDGAALTRFLAWFDAEAPKGGLTEISAAERLEEIRLATGALRDLSFPSISAYGPHAALPHYRVSRESDLKILPGNLYLIDSGGQYEDGTTDVTRTLAVGEVPEPMARAFTLALKGMVALSRARFPVGTTGAQLDALARLALWKAGLDYDHGTGHGVGAYLNVHEGPVRIARTGTVALEPGMILSNEPGYYKAGEFGLRIENLLLVTPPEIPEEGERPMMGFETLTLAPIDRRLILTKLLRKGERAWIDAYHARVREALEPLLEPGLHRWLGKATAPLKGG
ncbi:aminopeptidase P family protein [Neomegalonema sp.]|uniref:aminopeptidase P family protein n=1 Tax=Neomegalonema sp. TaxID=2039713 RepID=UPI00260EC0F2|nr:aminopeptidase P family protein [Neomegalonema sp.]MDD2867090.1 aminopeptidase P family protein [Neomegalonema sp.]